MRRKGKGKDQAGKENQLRDTIEEIAPKMSEVSVAPGHA